MRPAGSAAEGPARIHPSAAIRRVRNTRRIVGDDRPLLLGRLYRIQFVGPACARSCDASTDRAGRQKDGFRFGAAEIAELDRGIARFMGFSKIAISLGQIPESMPTTVVPTPE